MENDVNRAADECRVHLVGSHVHEPNNDDIVADAKMSAREAVCTTETIQPQELLQLQLNTNRLMSKHSSIAQRQARMINRSNDNNNSGAFLGSQDCDKTENDRDLVLPMPQSGDLDPKLSKNDETGGNERIPSSVSTIPTLAAGTTSVSITNPAWKPIPRPSERASDDTATTEPAARKVAKRNDNFVRLNLRNKAGSCLNARNRNSKSKSTRRWQERQAQWKEQHSGNVSRTNNKLFSMPNSMPIAAGVDPVDDFVDGVYTGPSLKVGSASSKTIPVCTGHQQPCKLLTVKKTGPNKGRKFYACPNPRSEQCNHFQWADDTLQAAQDALLRNRSQSGFVARQVASYMGQIRDLTVPELRDLARRHQLDATGKKAQLLMRLTIWVRDEVAATCGVDDSNAKEIDLNDNAAGDIGTLNNWSVTF